MGVDTSFVAVGNVTYFVAVGNDTCFGAEGNVTHFVAEGNDKRLGTEGNDTRLGAERTRCKPLCNKSLRLYIFFLDLMIKITIFLRKYRHFFLNRRFELV